MIMNTLQGINVISFTRAAAGSACAKILTEFGANTILVEPVKGHPLRKLKYYEIYHGDMKSVPINLRDPRGMEFMHKLLEKADVFVSNYRPQALVNMGLDYDSLKDNYPRLIHATVTGYGENGPVANDPGFDITAFWARAGLINDLRDGDNMPLVVPAGLGDIEAGKSLALGVITALLDREKTGKGMKIATSLYSEGIYANHCAIMDQQWGIHFPKTRTKPDRALKNSFPCRDGWIQMMTLKFEKDFPNIMHIVGREDLIDKYPTMASTEGEAAPELTAILDEGFQKLTVDEAISQLKAADIACSAYYPGIFTVTDEQADANNYYEDIIELKEGRKVRIPRVPVQFGEDGVERVHKFSRLGEDSVPVLKEFGYSEQEIKTMIQDNVVVSYKE